MLEDAIRSMERNSFAPEFQLNVYQFYSCRVYQLFNLIYILGEEVEMMEGQDENFGRVLPKKLVFVLW